MAIQTRKHKDTLVKVWYVTRGTRPVESELYAYDWEKEDGIKPQKCFVICPTRDSAERWKDKWNGGNKNMKVKSLILNLSNQ